MSKERFNILVDNYLAESLAEHERLQLVEMLLQPEYEQLLDERLRESFNEGNTGGAYAGLQPGARKELVKSLVFNRINAASLKTVHRVQFLRTAWFRWAAIFILFIGGGALYFINISKQEKQLAQLVPAPAKDILPGSSKAILTLSNGEKIELNNATSEIINDGNQSIKNNSGQLTYAPIPSYGGVPPGAGMPNGKNSDPGGGVGRGETMLNTMSTSAGGQYQLTLSDGTKVWLNAASSITYPVAFNGKTREVKISGEAYFEVAPNSKFPFIVKTNKEEITVLGTSFNVNTYENEPSSKTSLITGSIKINNKILKPGEALIDNKIIKTNIDQDIAWKNGVFNFHRMPLENVMRQLARWYDIKISYQNKPNIILGGTMGRDLTLQQALKVLSGMGVKYKLEGRELIIE